MPNRFTDSEKFKNKWYRNLTPKHKCMWEYFTSECNIAGILEIDLEMMSFCIGEKITIADFEIFEDRVLFIKEDLVFIPSFVLFQQKINTFSELNYKNKAHKGILAILEKYNIDDSFKGALKPLVRGKGKGKGKGIGKGIGIGIGIGKLLLLDENKNFKIPLIEEIQNYCIERKNNISAEQFYDYYSSKGWMIGKNKMKDWKAAVRTWERNQKKENSNENKEEDRNEYTFA